MSRKTITIYTDGGFRSTVNIGACAFVAVHDDGYSPNNFYVSYCSVEN